MADIYSVGTPGWGSAPGAGPGLYSNMGMAGPGLPGIEWAPRGANSALGAAFAAMGGGVPPTTHGHIQLKSHDFISQQYLTPPWGDESEKYIMPDMLCFTLGANRSFGQDEAPNTTVVLTLAALNQLLHSQWDEFQASISNGDQDSIQFATYLNTFGEDWLETYHKERQSPKRWEALKNILGPTLVAAPVATPPVETGGAAATGESGSRGGGRGGSSGSSGGGGGGGAGAPIDWDALETFYQMATKTFFCWQTRFGILSRVHFAGSVMNVNRGTSLEGYENVLASQHYTQVTVGLAKRVRVANVFGDREHVTTGSKVWLTLKRKQSLYKNGAMGAYCVVPGGSHMGWPTVAERTYKDGSGREMVGWVWRVGIVSTPPQSYCAQSACQRAANIGYRVTEREAYEFHATIPPMYVNFGYSW
jgi:hypothetical protein